MRSHEFLPESEQVAFDAAEISGMKFRLPLTPSFKAWFGNGKVKRVVYHATTAQFSEFDTDRSDLGAHFASTLTQANRIAMARHAGAKIIPCFINLTNPLRLNDTGTFHAQGIALQLERKGIIPEGEGKRITKEGKTDWKLTRKYDSLLRKAIIDAGYDGVVYKNEHEGVGDSYIVFSPKQVKFAGLSEVSDSNDFLKESLQQAVASALPATYTIPELQNQDPYRQYRFMIAMAASKSNAHRDSESDFKTEPSTPWGENMIVVSYGYDVGPDIDAALKQIGLSGKKLISTAKSEEPRGTNVRSIVPKL